MKIATTIVGCLVFAAGILLSNVLEIPEAVNASIELVNSKEIPGGGLQSGFDTIQVEILKGLKGLWSLLFSLGLTGLAWGTRAIAWGAVALNRYFETKAGYSSATSNPDDDWDLLEPLMLKAIEDCDREFVIQLAERMAGKPFMREVSSNAKA